MIKTVNIKVNAGNVNYPLGPFYIFKDSAASLTITDVPKPLGVRVITGVTVKAKNADGTEIGVAAVRNGSAWGATVPASHWGRAGTIATGIVIYASGKDDANNNASWTIGTGQVYVLAADSTIVPEEQRWECDWYDTTPIAPKRGNIMKENGVVKIYDGSAWKSLGGGGDGDVKRADFAAVDALPVEFTENEMRTKLNTVISILKTGASAVFMLSACCLSAFSATVQTALKGDVKNTAPIVTNVTFEGLLTDTATNALATVLRGEIAATSNDVTLVRYDASDAKLKHGDMAVTAADVGAASAEVYTSDSSKATITLPIDNGSNYITCWGVTGNDAGTISSGYGEFGTFVGVGGMAYMFADHLQYDAHTINFPAADGTLALVEDISATNPTFSNAVLAVGLNIDTNSVAVLNEIAATFGGFPIAGTATTVGGLLAALAAAIAWLRKRKIDTLACSGVANITTQNGTADVSTLFSSDNTSLVAVCREYGGTQIKQDENGNFYYEVEVED